MAIRRAKDKNVVENNYILVGRNDRSLNCYLKFVIVYYNVEIKKKKKAHDMSAKQSD